MKKYCEEHKMNVFDIIPTTFIVNFSEKYWESDLYFFLEFFSQHLPLPLMRSSKNNPKIEIKKKFKTVKYDISH
jgi:hypothetical protein